MTVALVSAPARAATIQDITSPSGIKAWLVEDYTVPIVAMNIAFRGGAAQDPDGKAGLANLMSGLLDEGAGRPRLRAPSRRSSRISASISPSMPAPTPSTAVCARFRPIRTRPSSFSARRSTSRASTPSRSRAFAARCSPISGKSESNPNEIVGKALGARRFSASHPYGVPNEGTVDSVATITADDLKAFHARTMARDNLHIVIVGAIDAAKAGAAIETIFGALPAHATSIRSRIRRRQPARRCMRRLAFRRPRSASAARPEARRSRFHRRLCRRRDSRRRHVLLAPLQGGARGPRACLFGRHRPRPLRPRRRLRRSDLGRRGKCRDRGPDHARRDQALRERKARPRRSLPKRRTTSSAISRCASIPRRRSRATSSASSSTTSASTTSNGGTT